MTVLKNKNDNFFKKWTDGMAYVLGFFAADGCMIRNNRGAHFIEFHITDRDILVNIKRLLESDNKISERDRIEKHKKVYRLQIGSKEIFSDLLNLGFTTGKSKKLRLPVIPKKYFSHFVRGYFDGDGNVFVGRRADRINRNPILQVSFSCGSEHFLRELKQRLAALAKTSGGTLYYSGGAFRLSFSIADSLKLHKFIYNSTGKLVLYRKKKIFDRFIKMDR